MNRKLATVFLLLVIAVSVGGYVMYANHQADVDRREQAFRDMYKAQLVRAMKTYYFLHGELPPDAERFDAAGVHSLDPETFNQLIEFKLNEGGMVNAFTTLTKETYPHAFADAKEAEASWAEELAAARKPWLDREGDLRAQLSLFLDPAFDTIPTVKVLEAIRDQYGVPEAKLIALTEANADLTMSTFYAANPELAVDHPDFIAITKSRTRVEIEEATAKLRILIDEIMAIVDRK